MLSHPKYLRRVAFWICASLVNQPFEIVMFEETIILYAKIHVNIRQRNEPTHDEIMMEITGCVGHRGFRY
jgi:hypothetical protein